MSPTPNPGFEVSISVATRELLVRLHDEAIVDGQNVAFLSALRAISERLRTDPISLGEELFDLKALHLTVKIAVLLPVAVEFGVYLDRRLVFIRTFHYVPPA